MLAINATDMRKDFGRYIDEIVRTKPILVKRSRDYFMGISVEMFKELVKDIVFEVQEYIEEDDTVTLSLDGFDIVVNEDDREMAIKTLIRDLREYALEYYEDIEYWSSDINRRNQLNRILKVLLADDEELGESFLCQTGKN